MSLVKQYVFVVSADINKFKEELKKAEDIAITAPFFPVDWEPDGSKKYVLGDVLYFENMLDCAKFVLVLMNTIAKRGAFDINPLIIGSEFLSTSETVKVIKSCSDEEIKNVENLKSTLAVFYATRILMVLSMQKNMQTICINFLWKRQAQKCI